MGIRPLRLAAACGLATSLVAVVVLSSSTTTHTATAVIDQTRANGKQLNASLVRSAVTSNDALTAVSEQIPGSPPANQLQGQLGVAAVGTADRPQDRIAVRFSSVDVAKAQRIAGQLAADFVAGQQAELVAGAAKKVDAAEAAVRAASKRVDELRRKKNANLEEQIGLEKTLSELAYDEVSSTAPESISDGGVRTGNPVSVAENTAAGDLESSQPTALGGGKDGPDRATHRANSQPPELVQTERPMPPALPQGNGPHPSFPLRIIAGNLQGRAAGPLRGRSSFETSIEPNPHSASPTPTAPTASLPATSGATDVTAAPALVSGGPPAAQAQPGGSLQQRLPAADPASGKSMRWIPNPEWSALSAKLAAMKARRLNLLKSMTAAHPLVRQSQQRIDDQIARMEGVPTQVLAPHDSAAENSPVEIESGGPPRGVPAGEVASAERRRKRLALDMQLASLRSEQGRLERELSEAALAEQQVRSRLSETQTQRQRIEAGLVSHVVEEVVTTRQRSIGGIGLATAITLGLGVGFVLLRLSKRINRTFASGAQAESELGVQVLATISPQVARPVATRIRRSRITLRRVGWGASSLVAAAVLWLALLSLADGNFLDHLAAHPVDGFLASVDRLP